MAAANASPRAVRTAVLRSTIGDFAGHQLEVDCGGQACRGRRRYVISDLAGRCGGDVVISAVVRRLRCQECGGKAVSVALLRQVGVRKPTVIRVPLIGPEARD